MNPTLRRWWKVVIVLIRIGVGGLFLVAGARKAADPFRFLVDVLNFHAVGYPVAVILALFIPWVEIVAGLALAFRTWRASALGLLFMLLLVFTGVLVSAWIRGVQVPCGCFGASIVAASPAAALVRNALLLTAVAFLLREDRSRDAVTQEASPSQGRCVARVERGVASKDDVGE
ncbi:MAG: DoxX family protein [Verrucomicrobiae bacterium]|nr:DoxX family protein [Verrucomicrobiae bacterium]